MSSMAIFTVMIAVVGAPIALYGIYLKHQLEKLERERLEELARQ